MAKDKTSKDQDQSKDIPANGTSDTAANIELQHLRQRVHDMEEAVHAYLTRQTSVGHERISKWLDKVMHRHTVPSTQPAQGETSPDTASTEQTESSGSSTSAPSKGTGAIGDQT